MQEIFVTVPAFLQALLTQELEEIGVPKTKIRQGASGVFVPKKMEWVYKINYCSRLATRVLWPFAQFACRDREQLYRNAYKVFWADILTAKKSFAIDANVSSPTLRHSLFAAQVLKDAICDRFRDECGERPSVKVGDPDIQLNLFIQDDMATICLDTSGAPLYKRGWRKEAGVAPLQESLAAAALRMASFSTDEIFCDPFCGSGTLLMEAMCLASQTPAGFFRTAWGFIHHPSYCLAEWRGVKTEADSQRRSLPPGKFFGADKDPQAIEVCKKNLSHTGFEQSLSLTCKDVRSYFPTVEPTCILTNPPYGKRLKSSSEIYQAMGSFIRTRCAKKCTIHMLCPDETLIHSLDLPILQKIPFSSGGLDLFLFILKNRF